MPKRIARPPYVPNGCRIRHRICAFESAIREVEARLLADGEILARFLGVARRLIPGDPESLVRPKEAMVNVGRGRGGASFSSVRGGGGYAASQGRIAARASPTRRLAMASS